MLKSLSLMSVRAITLLATTQAYSHVLCAPNNPQVNIGHQHNQTYTVPRIQPVVQHVVTRTVRPNHNQQKHLQAQRARQQKALANQRRINQQRRQQARRAQQQAAARKAQIIRQQQAAAQQARAARQKAALQAARYRAPAPAPRVVYQQPVQQQVTHYHAPQPVYSRPVAKQYVPSRTSVSFQVNTSHRIHNHTRRNIHRAQRPTQVLRFPQQPRRVLHKRAHQKRYHAHHNAHRNYQWVDNKH